MADMNYRPMGFESDVANPQFAGAADPEQFLFKQFYWHEPIDRNKSDEASEKEGRPIKIKGPKTIYIRVMKPGDQTSILETPMMEDHKRMFPREWLNFQMQEGLIPNTAAEAGWKVEHWDELTPDEIHKLKFNRFYTVEQIANASDGAIQGFGMGGEALRKRAQDALFKKNAHLKVA